MMYVTYGLGTKFDIDKLQLDLTYRPDKPKKAWWGSPVDAEFGWKEWCEAEDFTTKSMPIEEYFSDKNKIVWKLKEGTKKLDIKYESDLQNLLDAGYITIDDTFPVVAYPHYKFDFNKILEDGYSAIELFDSSIGHSYRDDSNWELSLLLNSWDCESIVVLDPSVIETVD